MKRPPARPIATNHSSITQPNTEPIRDVPTRWTQNRPIRIAAEIGTTSSLNAGFCSEIPSTAPSTETAGVITPSP